MCVLLVISQYLPIHLFYDFLQPLHLLMQSKATKEISLEMFDLECIQDTKRSVKSSWKQEFHSKDQSPIYKDILAYYSCSAPTVCTTDSSNSHNELGLIYRFRNFLSDSLYLVSQSEN
jgi:hypothetical protein